MLLSSEWNNEAYVSLHLVQEILEESGLPKRSDFSHWYPQFPIIIPNNERMPLSLYAENETGARKVAEQLRNITDELVERIDSLEP